jgi:hypothetical protein
LVSNLPSYSNLKFVSPLLLYSRKPVINLKLGEFSGVGHAGLGKQDSLMGYILFA